MITLLIVAAVNWLAFPVAALLLLFVNGPGRVYAWRSPCLVAEAGPLLEGFFDLPLVERLTHGFKARAFTWACCMFTFGPLLTDQESEANNIRFGLNSAEDSRLVRHETHHARWALILGVLFVFAYLGCMAWLAVTGKRPYEDNPFEVAATRAESRPTV